MNNRVIMLVLAAVSCAWATPIAADEPDPTFAYEVYQVADQWVRRGNVPQQGLPVEVRGVVAVHATLRKQGAAIGQATATIDSLPGDQNEAVDVMGLTRTAVSQALDEAIFNASPASSRDKEGQLTYVLDLQFAWGLEKLRLTQLADMLGQITPSGHGLAMAEGQRWAWMFPGNAVAANYDLNSQLNRLLGELKIPPDRKQHLGTPQGPSLYRFDVIHLARIGDDARPTRLHRGQDVLQTSPLDEQVLELLSEQLADYLIHRQRKDGSFAGTYEPTSDQYRPVTADNWEAALAVYALSRAATLQGVSQQERRDAADLGVKSLLEQIGADDVEKRLRRQVIGYDAAPTALTLLALLDAPDSGSFKAERDQLSAALLAMQDQEGWFSADTSKDRSPANLATQAMAVAALVELFDQTRDPAVWEAGQKALDALWRKAPPSPDSFEALPWIAIAELTLQRLERPSRHRHQLVELCNALWERQVRDVKGGADRLSSPDTIGGFRIGTGIVDEPNWLSTWALSGIAVTLRDPQLVPENQRDRWLVGTALGARFLHQLSFQSPSTYYTRSPVEALGGMRVTFWDNRQPLSATAAALLATIELRISLKRLSQKQP